MPETLWTVLKVFIVVNVVMLHVAYVVYFERKVIGHMQARLGPMRVGWHGLLQPIADGIKLFFKEDIIPSSADKPVFYIAPVIGVIAAIASFAVIPMWEGFSLANINIGILYLLALSSIGSYSIILGGWASNSKYSFLGGLRSSAQVISYEIAMGMSLVGVMMLSGSANLTDIVNAQSQTWFIVSQPVAFFVFLMAAVAETNRTPFDLPEAETELVAGYATEYSGFRYGLFFMAEYAGMFAMSAVATVCFFGGWKGPDVWFLASIPGVVWFLLKIYGFIFFYFWIRATLPRYRYDQLMGLGWKLFIPLALANIIFTGLIKLL
ncbi:MAG TPA: NADH-quinone oxidoreductase subunit NuoH [Nitrospirae bacterium]|nr:NADH-quinone oxidoreductase subunit H [bacterium BMS3Abin06]HDH11771.1 NADH-quinone oxidoreductase subunit NuoH [Nitrospirota bacterium]HDZ02607.1 NADH-quinone oxidoreductase subunit NuoH [Nitrospirota bacterium]